MHEAEEKEIIAFLKSAKSEIVSSRYIFLNRCTADIINLGLTIRQAKHELLRLRCVDYDRGPTADYNGDGTDIWEFGKSIDGKMVYIKLKIHPVRGCICMSFKESGGPFTLPYKNIES